MAPDLVGEPLVMAKRAVEDGLKTISDAVPPGPTGGVVWFSERGRRAPRGERPVWVTE